MLPGISCSDADAESSEGVSEVMLEALTSPPLDDLTVSLAELIPTDKSWGSCCIPAVEVIFPKEVGRLAPPSLRYSEDVWLRVSSPENMLFPKRVPSLELEWINLKLAIPGCSGELVPEICSANFALDDFEWVIVGIG